MKRIVTATLFALVVVLIVATPVLAYIFRAPYSVSNNSTSVYSMIGVSGAINNSWMAANGYMNASANDTRIESLAGTAMPHMVVEDRTQTAIPVTAFSQTNLYYTTGNSELLSFDIIPGYDGYITASDNATLEPGNNFDFEISGYFDTDNGTDKNIVTKGEALTLRVNPTVSENVSLLFSSTGTRNVLLNVTDNGTEMNIPLFFGAPTHWQAVGDSDNGSAVYTTDAAFLRDFYVLEDMPSGSISVDNVTYTLIIGENNEARIIPVFEIGGASYNGTELVDGTGTPLTVTEVFTVSPATSVAWTVAEINAMQIGISIRSTGVSQVRVYRISLTVSATVVDELSAAVTSGEHIIGASGNTTHIKLLVDGVVQDSASFSGIFNNSENWTFMDGNSVPYADNITLAVSGTRQLYYYPNDIIINDNLPDRAGTSQNGTFIWGANPTGLTVTLGSLTSFDQPSLGADIDQPTQDILEDVEVSDWFVDPDVGVGGALLTNPIRPFVTLLSDNSTLTESQVWRLYGLAFVLFVTVATATVIRGHYGITGIMCAASIVGLIALTVWPIWALVFAIGAVVCGLVAERSPSL